jgi:hypothetical protein
MLSAICLYNFLRFLPGNDPDITQARLYRQNIVLESLCSAADAPIVSGVNEFLFMQERCSGGGVGGRVIFD